MGVFFMPVRFSTSNFGYPKKLAVTLRFLLVSNVYEISSSILGSHEIYNESNGDVIFSGNIQDGTKLNRLGKGIGSLFLNETSDISGECNISNDNDGNIFVDGELKSDTIVYTGGSKKDIYINSYANFLGKATFNNSSNYRIFFDGTMSDNATLNSLGKSSNKIEIGKGCTVEGSSTIRNDSDGGFFIDKCFFTFYNDLINGLENFTYNASNFGSCYFQKGVCLGKNITINNYSNRDLIIEDTTSIGDNSIITLSKDTVSDVRLRKIIPANSVVNL